VFNCDGHSRAFQFANERVFDPSLPILDNLMVLSGTISGSRRLKLPQVQVDIGIGVAGICYGWGLRRAYVGPDLSFPSLASSTPDVWPAGAGRVGAALERWG
jgi:hypothetical protein